MKTLKTNLIFNIKMEPIYSRNVPPPIEKFDHTAFIGFITDWIKPVHYLELGLREGNNFREVAKRCQRATAVDMVPINFQLSANCDFYEGTTDDYFKSLEGTDALFDAIFIDADHSHGQSLQDFINAQRFLIDDGFIFMHDTYPLEELYIHPGFCNDCYKTPLYIKTNLSDQFEVLTLPFHPGLTVIKKMRRDKQLIWK